MSRRDRKVLRRQGKKYRPDQTIEDKKEGMTDQGYENKQKEKNRIFDFYQKHHKKAMLFTLFLLIISIIIIAVDTATTGEPFPRGVSLKGGVTITVPHTDEINTDDLQYNLRQAFSSSSISVRSLTRAGEQTGFIVDASDADPDLLLKEIEKQVGNIDNFSLETMGSALGAAFFKQTLFAILMAFVLMAVVVFLSFKTFIPSFAVILSAFSDIVMTIAIIDIFGIKIETAGIAAMLMLIGYSVDTDILLTTRLIKRTEGTVFERLLGAMKTGLTMTITSIAAIIVSLIFTNSETLRQIMLILLIGLLFDLMNTWIQNTGILLMYINYKSKKNASATLAEFNKVSEEKDSTHSYKEHDVGKSNHNMHHQKTHNQQENNKL